MENESGPPALVDEEKIEFADDNNNNNTKKRADLSEDSEFDGSGTHDDDGETSNIDYEDDPDCDNALGKHFEEFAHAYFSNSDVTTFVNFLGKKEEGRQRTDTDFVRSFLNDPASLQFLRKLTKHLQDEIEKASSDASKDPQPGSTTLTSPATTGDPKPSGDKPRGTSGKRGQGGHSERRAKRTCRHPHCSKQPYFNFAGETKGVYCSNHKEEGMRDVKNKKCNFPGCAKQPSFNFQGESKGKYCSGHKEKGMVDVLSRRCEFPVCHARAYFNVQGEARARYCADHKSDGMTCVHSRRCKVRECSRLPHYGRPGDPKAAFCTEHQLEGMVDFRVTNNGQIPVPKHHRSDFSALPTMASVADSSASLKKEERPSTVGSLLESTATWPSQNQSHCPSTSGLSGTVAAAPLLPFQLGGAVQFLQPANAVQLIQHHSNPNTSQAASLSMAAGMANPFAFGRLPAPSELPQQAGAALAMGGVWPGAIGAAGAATAGQPQQPNAAALAALAAAAGPVPRMVQLPDGSVITLPGEIHQWGGLGGAPC